MEIESFVLDINVVQIMKKNGNASSLAIDNNYG